MEYLNKIELKGLVGHVNIINVANTRGAHFSLLTQQVFRNAGGETVVEDTWHEVTAWEDKGVRLDAIEKGAKLHVTGRIRFRRYAGVDGIERSTHDIYASMVEPC